MFTFLIGLSGSLIALIGFFGFHSLLALFIGTALYVIETLIEWNQLEPGAKGTDIVIFIVGVIVSCFIPSLPWYAGGMIAIAIYSLILGIVSIIPIIRFLL